MKYLLWYWIFLHEGQDTEDHNYGSDSLEKKSVLFIQMKNSINTVLKFREWLIFGFFTILFSRMGLPKAHTL